MSLPLLRRAVFTCIWAVTLAGASACHQPDRYQPLSPDNPDGLNPDDVLALSAAPASIPADGVSKTRITAKLNPAATIRTMAFTTSHGTLLGNGQSAGPTAKLTLSADSSGVAAFELRSSADVTIATVTATITVTGSESTPAQTLVRTLDVSFVPVRADELLQLEVDRSSLPADGFSTAVVTATVRSSGDLQQNVTFATSRGTLTKFGAAAGDTGTTVKADATGTARIQLRTDTTIGTARVTANVLGFERELFVNFVPVNPTEILTVAADRSVLPADGATRTRIVARMSPEVPDANRQVTFTTSDGTFTSNVVANSNGQTATVKADASNLAIVELRSPDVPAIASITATASNVTARTSVTFERALPDTIFLQATAASVARPGAQSIEVTAFLLRDVGQVTTNIPVTFEARDASGSLVGTFSNVSLATVDSSDSSAIKRLKATATFNPDDTVAVGAATISARVGSVEGRLTVQITN